MSGSHDVDQLPSRTSYSCTGEHRQPKTDVLVADQLQLYLDLVTVPQEQDDPYQLIYSAFEEQYSCGRALEHLESS